MDKKYIIYSNLQSAIHPVRYFSDIPALQSPSEILNDDKDISDVPGLLDLYEQSETDKKSFLITQYKLNDLILHLSRTKRQKEFAASGLQGWNL